MEKSTSHTGELTKDDHYADTEGLNENRPENLVPVPLV